MFHASMLDWRVCPMWNHLQRITFRLFSFGFMFCLFYVFICLVLYMYIYIYVCIGQFICQ